MTLSAGLVALLLALSEGQHWGWLSTLTLGVFAAAVAVLFLWVWVELHVDQPMVEIGMMRERTVFWTNVGGSPGRLALYGTYLLVPTFVQMPRGLPAGLAAPVHYGFGASVVEAGLFLLPASLVMLVVGPAGGIIERQVGARDGQPGGPDRADAGRGCARPAPRRAAGRWCSRWLWSASASAPCTRCSRS